jgi:Tol biopolymer transport system component
VNPSNPEQLSITGENAAGVCIAGQGRRLAYGQCFNPNSNVYRIDFLPSSPDRDGSSTALLTSNRHDSNPQISPDGKRIAFQSDRTGWFEIWICDSDGSNPVQVTSCGSSGAGSPRWSPDSKQIAFDSILKGDNDIYVIDADGGNPRRLTDETSEEVTPSWSRDGRWIYFASKRSGRWEVWKSVAEGGAAVQVTRRGGIRAFEAPDGKFIYYIKSDGPGIWRVPVNGGEEEVVVESYKVGWGNWAVVDDGIYFIKEDAKAGAAIAFYNFATRQVNAVAALGKVQIWLEGLAVSPDRQSILYTRVDPGNTGNITLVENFR